MDVLSPIIHGSYSDYQKNEIRNARIQNAGTAPTSPVKGQVYFNSSGNTLQIYDGTQWVTYYLSTVTLNNITAPTGSVSLNSQKITNLATPTASTDGATKGYVDSAIQGLTWKSVVRVATTANGTLASAFANGSTVDGVALVTGDRLLIKNQSTASENGIYVVAASGAPARADDANTGAELQGAACFIQEGTTNGNTAWTCTNDGTITVGSTNIVFTQFAAGVYSAGDGLQLVGNEFSAKVDDVFIEVNGSNELTAIIGNGGLARKYVGAITGNSSNTAHTITHNLNTKDVMVSIRGTSSPYTDTLVLADISTPTANTTTVTFATAPATGVNFSVTVIG